MLAYIPRSDRDLLDRNVAPVRARRDARECWIFIHVGRALCGHEGVVHGGLLATLLDESLARVVGALFR